MATKTINGSIKGTSKSYYAIKLELTSTADNDNNQSSATGKLYFRRTSDNLGYNYRAYNTYSSGSEAGFSYITLDGTKSSKITKAFDTRNSKDWILLGTFTKNNILHNADGTKTISVSATFDPNLGTSGLTGGSVNGTFTLDEIPRGSTIGEITSFNVEETFAVPINTFVDTAYQVLKIYDSSNNLLTTIDNIVSNQQINLVGLLGQSSVYNLTKDTNSYPFKFELTSYTDSTKETILGETNVKTINGLITNANPVFSNFSYTEADAEVLALTNNQSYVKGYSDIKISNLQATGQKGATIKYWNVNNNLIENTGSNEITIQDILTNSITVYAVDSRGNSTPLTKLISNFIDYFKITKGIQDYERIDDVTEQVRIAFEGTIKSCNFGVVSNNISASYRYKKTNESTWSTGQTSIVPTIENETYSFDGLIKGDTNLGFDIGNSYNVEVTVNDRLSSVTFSYLVQSGKPAVAFYGNKVALGDKYDETLDTFDTQINNALAMNDFKVKGEVFAGTNYNDKLVKQSELTDVLKATVLYEGSGSTSDITLNDNVSNYKFIEIFYSLSAENLQSVKVSISALHTVGFNCFYTSGNNLYLYVQENTISGNKITRGTMTRFTFNTNGNISKTTSNQIDISKVVGYK